MKFVVAFIALLGVQLGAPQIVSSRVHFQDVRGYALVIGNGAYLSDKLGSPTKDATEIASVLRRLHFEVDVQTDVNQAQMQTAVQTFTTEGKKLNLPMIFFFAGHGMQINGVNYLVPTDASFAEPADIPKRTLSLDSVFDAIRDLGNIPKIVILDACRSNPLAENSINDWIPGLAAPVNAPANTFIAYATNPGNIAADGIGFHSPYSRALLKILQKPGLRVEDIFRQVREEVQSNTDGFQTPWEHTSLIQPFYFWEPVYASVQVFDADDDALVLVNGSEVAGWNNDGKTPKKFLLQGGLNDVVVKLYNQRSYTGGIPWIGGHHPEGWHYALQIKRNDGSVLANLSDGEDLPADNGPHHGKLFTVAKFQILLNEQTGELTVVNPNFHFWQQ